MILSDVQTRVTKQFGDSLGSMIDNTDIARWATDAQLDIVRKTKLNEVETVMASVAAQKAYVISNVFEIRRVTYNGTIIKMATTAELDNRFPGRGATSYGTNTPTYWVPTQTGLEVFPIPGDNLGTIAVTHTRRPTPVVNPSDAFEIPEQYHEDIVRKCMERAYETDGQWNAAGVMKSDYDRRTTEALHDKNAGAGNSYPAVRCIPGDGGEYY